MKKILLLMLIVPAFLAIPFSKAMAKKKQQTFDYSKINIFAFERPGYAGKRSYGEKIFYALFKKENPLAEFNKLYQKGSNEAKMYAILAFYYLDREKFNKIEKEYKNKKINIHCLYNNLIGPQEMTFLIQAIRYSLYLENIPIKYVKGIDFSKIDTFAFGGTGYAGAISSGEQVFNVLFKKENPLAEFNKLYQKGSNEAKMYAIVAFYYLDKARFDKIEKEYQNKRAEVHCMSGCCLYTENLITLIQDVKKGQYLDIIPVKYKK